MLEPGSLTKGRNFSWLALKKRILIGEKLSKSNIVHNMKCVLCMEVEENVDHLFVQCKLAYQCWIFILQKLNFSMPLPHTLWDMFQDWPSLINHSFYLCIWKCIPTIVIWEMWWERNTRIFSKSTFNIRNYAISIRSCGGGSCGSLYDKNF